ncbi:MAG TPA: hypothetical protein VFY26_20640 [Anaerolineales bacterium]|nr:hypothetical protein [Anaerolineales bacterium]
MTTKVCTGCHLEKDISEFTWSLKGIKRHPRCNACRGVERKERYERNKEHELEYKFARQVRMREIAKAFVEEYKRTHPCVDCGATYPERVLTFDHVRGTKKKAISDMINQGYTIEAIQAEISKCEVRCLDCHHRRHHEPYTPNLC